MIPGQLRMVSRNPAKNFPMAESVLLEQVLEARMEFCRSNCDSWISLALQGRSHGPTAELCKPFGMLTDSVHVRRLN